ncbi:MAG: hypothetical protein RL161_968 [Bacteroidota bacterium]
MDFDEDILSDVVGIVVINDHFANHPVNSFVVLPDQ